MGEEKQRAIYRFISLATSKKGEADKRIACASQRGRVDRKRLSSSTDRSLDSLLFAFC